MGFLGLARQLFLTILLVLSVFVSHLRSDTLSGLIAHYRFEGDASDSSGGDHHGDLKNGAAIVTTPPRGQVLSLHGGGAYVDCDNDGAFMITEQITLTCWIKVNSFDVNWQAIITKGDQSWRLHRNQNTNALAFHCSGLDPNGITGTIDVHDGLWHHVAAVYDEARLYLYIDGSEDVSVDATGSINADESLVWIGGNSHHPGREWNGMLDDVRIYERALTPAEILDVFNDCNGNGTSDTDDIAGGTSQDCNNNGLPDECDLQSGLFEDCNSNGIPDSCDITAQTSEDLNGNGIPDECEDCNGNGVPDDQDIGAGTSQDCNGNDVPDECDLVPPALQFEFFSPVPVDLNSAEFVHVADLSGDGEVDLVVNAQNRFPPGEVLVFLNNGNGTFAPAVRYEHDHYTRSVSIGDIDRDNDLDLVVVSHHIQLFAFRNNGDGTFEAPETIDLLDGINAMVLEDLNGDTYLDIAVSNSDNPSARSFCVLLNSGDGTFPNFTAYDIGFFPGALQSGDMNQDGFPDLVFADQWGNRWRCWLIPPPRAESVPRYPWVQRISSWIQHTTSSSGPVTWEIQTRGSRESMWTFRSVMP